MKIQEMRNAVRIDLGASGTDLTDNEVERAVQRAVGDLSLRLPKPGILDVTVGITVTAEALTSGVAPGRWVLLLNRPLEPQSETITNAAATISYTRDIDYTIDYANGRITHILGGAITNSQALKVSYRRQANMVDLGPLNGSMFRVKKVAWQAGTIPETTMDFSVQGHMLEVRAGQDTQGRLTEGRHIWVYYDGPQDAPTGAAHGSYPSQLDELMVKGAGMYVLLGLASRQYLKAAADLELGRTRLLAAVAIHSAITNTRAAATVSNAAAGTAMDLVRPEVVKAGVALDRVNNLVGLAQGLLVTSASRGSTDPLGRAETELLGIAAILVEVDTELDKISVWLDAGGDSVKSALSTANNYLPTVTSDIAEAKTVLDGALTPLGLVTSDIHGIVVSDLAQATSSLSSAGSSITDAQVTSKLADDNLGNVAGYLSLAELSSAVSVLAAAVTDVDAFKSSAAITSALDKVTTQLDASTGAAKSLSNASADFARADTTLVTAVNVGGDADTTLDKVVTEVTAADIAAGDAKLKNDGGDQYATVSDLTKSRTDLNAAFDFAVGEHVRQLNIVEGYLNQARDALNKVTDRNSVVVTGVENSIQNWLDSTDRWRDGGGQFVTFGSNYINTVNTGKDVPENYAKFAEVDSLFTGHFDEYLKSCLQGAGIQLGVSESWIKEAAGRVDQAAKQVEALVAAGQIERAIIEGAAVRVSMVQQSYNMLIGKVQQAQAAIGIAQARLEGGKVEVSEGAARVQLQTAYMEVARTRVQMIAQYQQEASTRVEMARTFVQEGAARIQLMASQAQMVGVKVQAAGNYREIAGARVELARVWVQESSARSEIGRNLAEIARAHGEVATAQVNVATQRIMGVGRLVEEAAGRTQAGQALLVRVQQRIAQTQAAVNIAQVRAQAAGEYGTAAQQRLGMAAVKIQAVQQWIAEAQQLVAAAERYLAGCRSHTEEAQVRMSGGQVLVAEAHERSAVVSNLIAEVGQLNQEIQNLIAEAAGYQQSGQQSQGLGKEFQAAADSRRADYMQVLQTVTMLQADSGSALVSQNVR